MENYKTNSKLLAILVVCLLVGFQACKTEKKKEAVPDESETAHTPIEIVTEAMEFQMPDTINSGWNTFRYQNQSPYTHFFLIDKYPEGKTSEDAEKFVAPVFDRGMALIIEGKPEEGFAEFSKLPEWFSEVEFVGGSGLLSPNQTGETTVKIQPGNYIIECYVKMSNGIFHTSMGMTKDLVVSGTDSGNEPLDPDIEIEISSTEGIVFNDSIDPGEHVFSVYYKDQIVHENFVGHDVNLVRLTDEANIEELEDWMNWANPKGLMDPSPAGVTFLGGVNDMPGGNTGYFRADLEPGTYALISEVPGSLEKGLLKTFTVQNSTDQ